MTLDCPLYLHFLDRELGQSVGFSATERVVEPIIKCLLLGTTSQLFAGISLAWENPAMTGLFPELLSLLVQTRVLDLGSNHSTLDEFLATRISLYSHDSQRYGMYFKEPERKAREALIPTMSKLTSATTELAADLGAWSSAREGQNRDGIDSDLLASVQRKVSATLSNREEQAITFSLFARDLEEIDPIVIAEGVLRRRISSGYTKHYMDAADADIPTGIDCLSYFDRFARAFPLFDVPLLFTLLRGLGFSDLLKRPWKADEMIWARSREWRRSPVNVHLRGQVIVLLSALCMTTSEELRSEARESGLYAIRQAMLYRLREAIAAVTGKGIPSGTDTDQAIFLIRNILTFCRKENSFSRNIEQVLYERNENVCDVLIVVTTEIERAAVLKRARELTGMPHLLMFGRRRTYFDVGSIGASRVILVQTEMGSVGPGASHGTVGDAIDDLTPAYVLLVGIAFGVDPNKQQIGQILVSKQLQEYELQKIGSHPGGKPNLILRGDKVTASTTILGRLRATNANWSGSPVDFGLIISGEKLVDNLDFRNSLTELAPEALGGEMEGAGLYAASAERKIDWIVVKAICDWADGEKKCEKAERQQIAAIQAAGFVLQAVSEGGFRAIRDDGNFLI